MAQKLKLPPLPFALDALEPVIGALTVEAHHFGHQAAYVKNYNKLLKAKSKNKILLDFNYNGALLHQMYWENLIPGGSSSPSEILKKNFTSPYGKSKDIVKSLKEKALSIRGSGWSLLTVDKNGFLKVRGIQNHMLECLGREHPICVIDTWEHAYYLQYAFHKKVFFDNFMNLINWDVVEGRYLDYMENL